METDLVVEHCNATLKLRLAALGGRYTEESIERIGASLSLTSLLESKLYPTYTERLESSCKFSFCVGSLIICIK